MTKQSPTPYPSVYQQCSRLHSAATGSSNRIPSPRTPSCSECWSNAGESLQRTPEPESPNLAMSQTPPPSETEETGPEDVESRTIFGSIFRSDCTMIRHLAVTIGLFITLPWPLWKILVLPWIVNTIVESLTGYGCLPFILVFSIVRAPLYSMSLWMIFCVFCRMMVSVPWVLVVLVVAVLAYVIVMSLLVFWVLLATLIL